MSHWFHEAQLVLRKKILLRVDASREIGTGHVMRCLALANKAKQQGWECVFVLRDPVGGIVKHILSCGHRVIRLTSEYVKKVICNETAYSDWLPVSQMQDANETTEIINDLKPDWIIVDHYALDVTWFLPIRETKPKILVIDDLGDRKLICDFLLDQNLGASAEKYDGKLPEYCQLLLGPDFALLRDEFKVWRKRSLESRLDRTVENILITMGGGDDRNFTLKVLKEIAKSEYAKNYKFTIVIGGSYTHATTLCSFLNKSNLKALVLSDIKNIAEIMSKSDLCIGAGGSTSWERCCLGLPTISLAIAENQVGVLTELEKKTCTIISSLEKISSDFESLLSEEHSQKLRQLSLKSSAVCDGNGVHRLLCQMEQFCD